MPNPTDRVFGSLDMDEPYESIDQCVTAVKAADPAHDDESASEVCHALRGRTIRTYEQWQRERASRLQSLGRGGRYPARG